MKDDKQYEGLREKGMTPDRLQAGVGGIGQGHAGLQAGEEVIDDRLSDPLAGHDDWDAWWV